MDYTTLKNELLSDPVSYGYAQYLAIGDNTSLMNLLNKVRSGTDGFPAITVRNTTLTARDVLEKAIDINDFKANPSVAEAALFQATLSLGTMALVDSTGADTYVFTNLKKFFGTGTGTRTRLNGLANRNGSRAEQLFGSGTVISTTDIAQAKNLM